MEKSFLTAFQFICKFGGIQSKSFLLELFHFRLVNYKQTSRWHNSALTSLVIVNNKLFLLFFLFLRHCWRITAVYSWRGITRTKEIEKKIEEKTERKCQVKLIHVHKFKKLMVILDGKRRKWFCSTKWKRGDLKTLLFWEMYSGKYGKKWCFYVWAKGEFFIKNRQKP